MGRQSRRPEGYTPMTLEELTQLKTLLHKYFRLERHREDPRFYSGFTPEDNGGVNDMALALDSDIAEVVAKRTKGALKLKEIGL